MNHTVYEIQFIDIGWSLWFVRPLQLVLKSWLTLSPIIFVQWFFSCQKGAHLSISFKQFLLTSPRLGHSEPPLGSLNMFKDYLNFFLYNTGHWQWPCIFGVTCINSLCGNFSVYGGGSVDVSAFPGMTFTKLKFSCPLLNIFCLGQKKLRSIRQLCQSHNYSSR